jgi:vacuolar-type H+-ATPase subunit H
MKTRQDKQDSRPHETSARAGQADELDDVRRRADDIVARAMERSRRTAEDFLQANRQQGGQ